MWGCNGICAALDPFVCGAFCQSVDCRASGMSTMFEQCMPVMGLQDLVSQSTTFGQVNITYITLTQETSAKRCKTGVLAVSQHMNYNSKAEGS
jgi:hypothetical protein